MIRANFNTYNNYVTDSLYQWDVNQDLVINGLNLSVAPEIHFTNANMGGAIVKASTLTDGVITVKIPNSLLREALTIKVYVGIYEGKSFKVIETIEIPVIAKAKPIDYVIEDSDEELYSFKALEAKIDTVLAESLERYEQTNNALDKINDFEARIEEAEEIVSDITVENYGRRDTLSDATKLAYGLSLDKVPDDVFNLVKSILDDHTTELSSRAKIDVGYYTGGGTFGESNPNSLTFDFTPKLVILAIESSTNSTYFINGMSQAYAAPRSSATAIYLTWSGNTVRWYASDAIYQYNNSSTTYLYVAIG